MGTTTHALILQLQSCLENEKLLDYSNASYFGGFHIYLATKLQELQALLTESDQINKLIELVNSYPNQALQDRAMTIQTVQAALESLSQKEASASLYSPTTHHSAQTSNPKIIRNFPNKILFNKPIGEIKNVGSNRVKLFEKLGIKTVKDLLYHFPRKYEDRSLVTKIGRLTNGEVQTIAGQIISVQEIRPKKRLTILKATLADDTGKLIASWFNQAYMKRVLKPGKHIMATGKVDKKFLMPEMTVQEFELLEGQELIHTGRIVPFYSLTERLPQKFLRNLIFVLLKEVTSNLEETLPGEILERYKFLPLSEALQEIHFPQNWQSLKQAEKRFIYEELFDFQMKLIATKTIVEQREPGVAHQGRGAILESFLALLPFKLTKAQRRVINKIVNDMECSRPMSRLVQGDVGSGKTVVATFALLKAVDAGYQGALMAPTEILAEQHYLNLKEMAEKLGVKIALLTGSIPKKVKDDILKKLANGTIQIVVGTHALLQEHVKFKNLSLAVIDEQHRFGVMQRATLQRKGFNPDVLVLTATPIPRTLALTLYGDLDVSIIDELPPGRKPIMTRFVPENKRQDAYSFIKKEIDKGRQAYVVCPLIEESEAIEAEAALKLQAELQKDYFQEYKVGLLHGRLSTEEKEAIMSSFYRNEIPILVSTTVIEVGVDVPNASIMVIEGVERFGLSQLHQLRGRIGRGEHKSYCLLLGNLRSKEAKARVKILTTTSDGFVIAEEDLKLRGPGDFFGTRQHGLPEFKVANLLRDGQVLELCRRDAFEMLKKYPYLGERHTLLI